MGVGADRYDVVIPIVLKDIQTFLKNEKYLRAYLPAKRFVLIGNAEVQKAVPKGEDILFLPEDDIISYAAIRSLMEQLSQGDATCIRRTGWYLQQFLKMQYARICEDEFYLVWDCDTIPTHEIKMVDSEGKPFLDVNFDEYHAPYFQTMEKVLPGLQKVREETFITEHMLFSCKRMKALMSEIEETAEGGTPFYEIILRSVAREELAGSGFSEFELYGTYCVDRYPEEYALRSWRKLRRTARYFAVATFDDEKLAWVAPEYDALSFEKTMEPDRYMMRLCENPRYRRRHSFADTIRYEYSKRCKLVRKCRRIMHLDVK